MECLTNKFLYSIYEETINNDVVKIKFSYAKYFENIWTQSYLCSYSTDMNWDDIEKTEILNYFKEEILNSDKLWKIIYNTDFKFHIKNNINLFQLYDRYLLNEIDRFESLY